jgi:hypothetical protein
LVLGLLGRCPLEVPKYPGKHLDAEEPVLVVPESGHYLLHVLEFVGVAPILDNLREVNGSSVY